MKVIFKIVILSALLATAAREGAAQSRQIERTVKIIGRPQVVVTQPDVTLGDLAEVSSVRASEDEAVIALKRIVVERSPEPGKRSTISAAQLLERMRAAGVDLQHVGYTLPRVFSVERAGRAVTRDEVRSAVEEALRSSRREAAVRSISYEGEIMVAPGLARVSAEPAETGKLGELGFTINVTVEGAPAARFHAVAAIDEWREVPVATRSITRGERVEGGDVMMARLNVANLPRDTALDRRNVIGLETSREIGYGEPFSRSRLIVPPVITAGSKVTMIYRSKNFEATATGTALEAGAEGEEIRVRNSASRKTVTATVVEPGLAIVSGTRSIP